MQSGWLKQYLYCPRAPGVVKLPLRTILHGITEIVKVDGAVGWRTMVGGLA
jgi:hypothetical protein